jgi:hypothetical protein
MMDGTLEALDMGNTERISLIMPSELKQKLERLCKLENRSMSNMVVTLVQQAIAEAEEQGRLPSETPSPTDKDKGD